MTRVMSFPMRLDGPGRIASVEQDSDAHVEELIAVAMLTRPGERITVPSFGVADPAFARFQLGALERHCLDFGPDVQILGVSAELVAGDREQVVINWERRDDTREVVSE